MSSSEEGAASIPCIIIYCQPERKAQAGDAFCLLPWIRQCCGFGRFRWGECSSTCSLRLKRCRLCPGYLQGQGIGLVPQVKRDRHCNWADPSHAHLRSRSRALLTSGIEFRGGGWRGDGVCYLPIMKHSFKEITVLNEVAGTSWGSVTF